MTTLAKCPCCGSRDGPYVDTINTPTHQPGRTKKVSPQVICVVCGCRGPWGNSEKDAIEAWEEFPRRESYK